MISNLEIMGISMAHRAMRNPKNSWHMSSEDDDMRLSKSLYKAGPEHCKHLRMIQISMDIEAPRYFWQEFDTYQFITKVSCSTMHKLFDRPIKVTDFKVENQEDINYLRILISQLNNLREEYFLTKDPEILIRAKRLLPESYIQKRTIIVGLQQLLNILGQRYNHRVPEWRDFCSEIINKVEYIRELEGSLSKLYEKE